MFSQASVILFMGGWQTHSPWQTPPARHPSARLTPPLAIHPPAKCMLGYTHPCPVHAGMIHIPSPTATAVDGTHPTGMHSSSFIHSFIHLFIHSFTRPSVRAYVAGLPAEGDPDVVGEPDHGHAGVVGARHGASVGGAARAQTVRPHQAAHLPHHDEEHPRSRHLSTRYYIYITFCR